MVGIYGKIGNFNYLNAEAQKYWSFPSSYDKKKRQETLNLMLYSNDYVASEKRDGYFQFVIKDDGGNVFMRARSQGVNGWVCKQEWVPHFNSFFEALPNGTCLVCEVYLPGKTSKAITSILGCAKEKAIERQKESPLRLSVFDVLAFNGVELHDRPIIERIKYLQDIAALAKVNNYIDIVTYWDNPEDIHNNWLNILSAGGEGVVLTKKDNKYEFGKRTARHTLKLKKELNETIDVFLTGRYKEPTKLYTGDNLDSWTYWYDELKEEKYNGTLGGRIDIQPLTPVTRLWFYNMAGAVEIATLIDGKTVPIGWISGVADEVRKGIVENPAAYKDRVVELQAMEIDTTGVTPTLRHAKIVNWRPDKNKDDCIWQG